MLNWLNIDTNAGKLWKNYNWMVYDIETILGHANENHGKVIWGHNRNTR